MSNHDTRPPTESLSARCAACNRALGMVTHSGWVWTRGPARLVNRRRFVCAKPVGDDTAPSSLPDNFRMRSIQRDREATEYTVWEYPYVCDDDACMARLGEEWQAPDRRDVGPKYRLMPEGKLLS